MSDKPRLTQFLPNITGVLQCLHVLVVRMYIDHIMCNKKHNMFEVEIPMCFESVHSLPKLFKFLQVVTSLLIAYDGSRSPSQATRLFKHKNVVSCKKVIPCRWYTNERPHVKHGWSVIRRVHLRQFEKSRAVTRGPILGDVFES